MAMTQREQKMRQSALRLRIFVWTFFPCLGLLSGVVFGMGLLLGLGLGLGVAFMLDSTLRLMSSDSRLFRVRRE
jgi:hypothetical protein